MEKKLVKKRADKRQRSPSASEDEDTASSTTTKAKKKAKAPASEDESAKVPKVRVTMTALAMKAKGTAVVAGGKKVQALDLQWRQPGPCSSRQPFVLVFFFFRAPCNSPRRQLLVVFFFRGALSVFFSFFIIITSTFVPVSLISN